MYAFISTKKEESLKINIGIKNRKLKEILMR